MIAVVVPTFNRAEFLEECLDSLLGQTLPPSRLIVVNDGGSDRTGEIVRRYGPRLTYLKTENRGKSAALNLALDQVTEPYTWILDDDDVALPDALERFVEPLEANASCAFSYSPYYLTRSGRDGRIGTAGRRAPVPDRFDDAFLPTLLEENFLSGAAVFARTRAYARVGGFDEALFRSQDYEMAIRLASSLRGVRVRGGPTFHYRQHDGVRGHGADRFPGETRGAKWRKYDRQFFARLYATLPLERYAAGDGRAACCTRRAAVLGRMLAMASKALEQEVAADTRLLREQCAHPLNDADRGRAARLARRLHREATRALPADLLLDVARAHAAVGRVVLGTVRRDALRQAACLRLRRARSVVGLCRKIRTALAP